MTGELRAVLFDSGGVLIRPVGGRWNPRADFETTILAHDPTVTPERFARAIAAGEDFFAASESTPDCRKPDPRMYRHASDALGLRAAECVFVDDDPELVAAAIELGYSGRVLCRDGAVAGAPGMPVPSITDLSEIVELF